MKKLAAILLLIATPLFAQSNPLVFNNGRVTVMSNTQAISTGQLNVTGQANINTSPLSGSQLNVVASSGNNTAYFQSPNDSTAPWFVIRDGFTGTRGAGGAGDGNGAHFVFQSWSAATSAFVSSMDWNCGLIKASAPIASDCDAIGYRNGVNEVMMALDGLRPALIPGTDANYALGDINTGANHSLARWTYGYFSNSVCVSCTTVTPTDPFQANVAANSSIGINLSASSGLVHFSPSFAGGAYNSLVITGDAGIVPSTGTPFVIAPQMTGNGQGSRWSGTGVLTQTGPLIVTGSGAYVQLPNYTVSTLPTCNTGLKGGMAYVTDATAPTYNASLTGGGAVVIPVFCNGTAWTAH